MRPVCCGVCCCRCCCLASAVAADSLLWCVERTQHSSSSSCPSARTPPSPPARHPPGFPTLPRSFHLARLASDSSLSPPHIAPPRVSLEKKQRSDAPIHPSISTHHQLRPVLSSHYPPTGHHRARRYPSCVTPVRRPTDKLPLGSSGLTLLPTHWARHPQQPQPPLPPPPPPPRRRCRSCRRSRSGACIAPTMENW